MCDKNIFPSGSCSSGMRESLNIIVWGCRSWRKEKFEHSIIVSNGRINKFSCKSRSRQQINSSPSTKFFNLPRTSNRFNAMRGTVQELMFIWLSELKINCFGVWAPSRLASPTESRVVDVIDSLLDKMLIEKKRDADDDEICATNYRRITADERLFVFQAPSSSLMFTAILKYY